VCLGSSTRGLVHASDDASAFSSKIRIFAFGRDVDDEDCVDEDDEDDDAADNPMVSEKYAPRPLGMYVA
jgi:hypothetical protein